MLQIQMSFPVSVDAIPDDINGVVLYEVPINDPKGLKNMKGCRPWGKIMTSPTADHPKSIGTRLLTNCRGHYECINQGCPNNSDFGPNKTEFTNHNNQILCIHCKGIGKYVKCPSRLIIEKKHKKRKSASSALRRTFVPSCCERPP